MFTYCCLRVSQWPAINKSKSIHSTILGMEATRSSTQDKDIRNLEQYMLLKLNDNDLACRVANLFANCATSARRTKVREESDYSLVVSF